MDVAEANSLPQQLQTRGEAAAAGGRPGRRAWHRQTRGRVTHTLPDHKPQGTVRNCSLVGARTGSGALRAAPPRGHLGDAAAPRAALLTA